MDNLEPTNIQTSESILKLIKRWVMVTFLVVLGYIILVLTPVFQLYAFFAILSGPASTFDLSNIMPWLILFTPLLLYTLFSIFVAVKSFLFLIKKEDIQNVGGRLKIAVSFTLATAISIVGLFILLATADFFL